MAENSGISWTDATFNPWIGCTRVSPGCQKCYAESFATRRLGVAWGPGAPRRVVAESTWRNPEAWAHKARAAGVRRRVFCASLADLFDAEAPVAARRRLWELVAGTSHSLDWLLLTKRPERIGRVMAEDGLHVSFFRDVGAWLGATVEDMERARGRIGPLLNIGAAVHFLSCEPLLERVGFPGWFEVQADSPPGHRIDWVICGGESGPGARPFDLSWARSLRDECKDANVAFFMKQLGSNAVADGAACRTRHPKGENPDQWPADLRVREIPRS